MGSARAGPAGLLSYSKHGLERLKKAAGLDEQDTDVIKSGIEGLRLGTPINQQTAHK